MTTTYPSLTAFLLAQIEADETTARCASEGGIVSADGKMVLFVPKVLRPWTKRWLAECEAKRAIVTAHADWHVCPHRDGRGYTDYGDGSGDEWEEVCPTLRALALPYASAPGWQEAWR